MVFNYSVEICGSRSCFENAKLLWIILGKLLCELILANRLLKLRSDKNLTPIFGQKDKPYIILWQFYIFSVKNLIDKLVAKKISFFWFDNNLSMIYQWG